MNSKAFVTRRGTMTRRVGSIVAVAFLAVAASGVPSLAQTCIEDVTEANEPSRVPLGCTANDFGVGSVTVTNLIDPCSSEGDSFTFNGVLNITAESGGSAERYDIGFYIGADGEQALRGDCAAAILPVGRCSGDTEVACNTNTDCVIATGTCSRTPVTNDDTDTCGDYVGDSIVHAPITNVTAKCADADNDGFFDLAICTSYDNNAGGTCTGTDDAFPSTKSKCRCSTVNTNQEIPHCVTNGDCTTDNNVCTDEVCLGLADPNADFFGCGHVNNTASCDDGTFCNGADVCSGGTCGHAGNPCTGGGVCEVCNETDNDCFADAGTPCRASAGGCDIAEVCTGSTTTCPTNQFQGSGVLCRATTGVCDPAENCTGGTAVCPADTLLPSSTVCRGSAGECDLAEQCTGTSGACPGDSVKGNGTGCTTDNNICTDDICNGTSVTCQHNNNSAPCNDNDFCTTGDTCAGGTCSQSTPTNCDDGIDCTDDSCSTQNSECVNEPDDSFCDDEDTCTEDICSPVSGCISDLICADICRSPGYWATHSGYEKTNSVNVAQELLDIVGDLQVCGQTISATSNQESPFLEGLGLTSDLQGLCMRTKGVHQRQLYRQLVAAALNCAASGDANNCDHTVQKYIEVTFSDCSALCAGTPVVDGPTEGECIGQLDCFNNGGQIINGSCATGTCASQPEIACGGSHGDCPPINEASQECVPFENNCHEQQMCNEEIGFCPKKTPASSSSACHEARFDSCTIDSCTP